MSEDKKTMSVAQIAERLSGTLEGDGSACIECLSDLRDAVGGHLAFVSGQRYVDAAAKTHASAVIVAEDWEAECAAPVIRVKNVAEAVEQVGSWLAPPPIVPEPGIHNTAVVADDVIMGDDVAIGACAVVEAGVRLGGQTIVGAGCYVGHETVIGSECRLYPNVTVRERTRIGNNTIIHSGTVIGSDGYGYAPEEKDGKVTIRKIPQRGNVEIGDDVEIGANVTIDRARFGATRIGNGVKMDNLVQIAHNVSIGDQTGIVAMSGVAGSARVGSRVLVYGQAGIAGHLTVGDGAVVATRALVTKDVPPGSHVSGYPAMPHKKATRSHAALMRLPHLKQRVAQLEERLRRLEEDETSLRRNTEGEDGSE